MMATCLPATFSPAPGAVRSAGCNPVRSRPRGIRRSAERTPSPLSSMPQKKTLTLSSSAGRPCYGAPDLTSSASKCRPLSTQPGRTDGAPLASRAT